MHESGTEPGGRACGGVEWNSKMIRGVSADVPACLLYIFLLCYAFEKLKRELSFA